MINAFMWMLRRATKVWNVLPVTSSFTSVSERQFRKYAANKFRYVTDYFVGQAQTDSCIASLRVQTAMYGTHEEFK